MVIKVGVVGYGTIGKRVADAVLLQPDMELVGVTINSYNYRMSSAARAGIRLFALSSAASFPVPIAGTFKDLLAACDVIVDCSPKPQGLKNKEQYYLPAGVKVIYQGGEKAPVGQASFTAQCNYEQCVGLDHVRVVSCNTTGLARTIGAIDARWGVASAHVTLIRGRRIPGTAIRDLSMQSFLSCVCPATMGLTCRPSCPTFPS